MFTLEKVSEITIPQLLNDFVGYYSVPTGLIGFDYRRSIRVSACYNTVSLFHPMSRKPFVRFSHEETLYFASVIAECDSLEEAENLVDENWRYLLPAALRALALSNLLDPTNTEYASKKSWGYYKSFNQSRAKRNFYWLRFNVFFHLAFILKFILTGLVRSSPKVIIESDFLATKIHFATSRSRPTDEEEQTQYFSTIPDNKINYGYTVVNVPRRHVKGRLERLNLLKRHLRLGESHYFHIGEFAIQESDNFWKSIQKNSAKNSCLLYVHGFNVSFEYAILKSAQIKIDLETELPVISFSWPSQESVLKYSGDKDRADAAAVHLAQVLSELPKQGFTEVLLLSHSMGAQCLSKALSLLKPDQQISSRAVFSAPDITASHFRDRYEKIVRSTIRDTTIHVSSMDYALLFTRPVVDNEPRIGDCVDGVKVFHGMDTLDLSPSRSFFHLSSFSHNYSTKYLKAIEDLRSFLIDGLPPQKRQLVQLKNKEGQVYWKLAP